MLRLLSIITIIIIILRVKSNESCDDKYCLSTSGTPETAINLENARGKCENSWILEIYDENVITLLKNLNVNTQQNGILLGMEQSTKGWMWSDGTKFEETIEKQDGSTTVVCITNDNNSIKYLAKTIFDFAGVICTKVTTKDNCAGWFHNGLCYFKPITTTQKWFEAHNVCINNGASMAMFNNSETNFNKTFIDNQIYWVSLSRSTCMWTHADEVVTFNRWSSGQPDTNDLKCATTTSEGNEWKSVDCSGTYNIVCMKENHESSTLSPLPAPGINNITTQSPLPTPGINVITNSSKYSTVEESLSSGAKAGIGVGVSLLVVLIVLIGVLVFKYFHQLKKVFNRKKSSTKPTTSESPYCEVVKDPRETMLPGTTSSPIDYVVLDFNGHLDNNIKSPDD